MCDQKRSRHFRFMLEHAVEHPRDPCTHSSFLGWGDRLSFFGKWAIPPEPETILKYSEAVAYFYQQGEPVMQMEVLGRGPRKYCEDVDLLCQKGPPCVEDLLGVEFLTMLMALTASIFPDVDPRLHVFRSSGMSHKYKCHKISLHFVWDNIVVDEERAAHLRQYRVEVLQRMSEGSGMEELPAVITESQARMVAGIARANRDLDDRNQWDAVFDRSVVCGGNGLRVPLSDKRESVKHGCRKPPFENRPKVPLGTWELDRATCCARMVETHLQIENGLAEFVRRGLCHLPPTTPLTNWVEPPLQHEFETRQQRSRNAVSNGDAAAGGRSVEHAVSSLQRLTAEVRPWTPPARHSSEEGTIIVRFHGVSGQRGIAGAASVLLFEGGKSDVLFRGCLHIAGSYHGSCREYLALLVGLFPLESDSPTLKHRRLMICGDSRAIQQLERGLPHNPSAELYVLAQAAHQCWTQLESLGARLMYLETVPADELWVEEKLARQLALSTSFSSEDPKRLNQLLSNAEVAFTQRQSTQDSLWDFRLPPMSARPAPMPRPNISARPAVAKPPPPPKPCRPQPEATALASPRSGSSSDVTLLPSECGGAGFDGSLRPVDGSGDCQDGVRSIEDTPSRTAGGFEARARTIECQGSLRIVLTREGRRKKVEYPSKSSVADILDEYGRVGQWEVCIGDTVLSRHLTIQQIVAKYGELVELDLTPNSF